jgi:hypothetical protein
MTRTAARSGSGTWLCPTAFDRARLVDMEERLQWARAVMFGMLGVGFAIAAPWLGWGPVVLVITQVVVYAALRRRILSSDRPEYPVAIAVVLAQVLIAIAVAITGASESAVLLVFLLGVGALPARFGTNGVVAGVLLTELLIFASTAGVDPAGFAAHPERVIITATSTFGLAAFVHALMQAESQKRSESVYDVLTGLPNRRGMEGRFEDLRARALDTGSPLALLLCDLDTFKSVNDGARPPARGCRAGGDGGCDPPLPPPHRAHLPRRRRGVPRAGRRLRPAERGVGRRACARGGRGGTARRAAGHVLDRRGRRVGRGNRLRRAVQRG